MPEIVIKIDSKISPNVTKSIKEIILASNLANAALKRIKKSLLGMDKGLNALAKITSAQAKLTNANAKEANATARLSAEREKAATLTIRLATAATKLALAKNKLRESDIKLATAAARVAEARTKALKANLEYKNSLTDILTRDQKLILAEQKVKQAVLKTAAAVDKAADRLTRIDLAKKKAAKSAVKLAAANKKAARSFKRVSNAAAGLTRTLKTLFVFYAFSEVVKLADDYTNMENRLKLVTKSSEQLVKVQKELFEIANRSRTPIADVTLSFQRFDLALTELGKSQKESLQFTETLAKTLAISGLSTMEASQGLRQFSQALNKGKLDGDEFRTVMETMPVLSKALAKELGVARSELLALAPTGVITAEVMTNAVLGMKDDIEKAFGETNKTIGQAFAVLRNKITELLGEFNKSTGVFNKFADGIIFVSDHLEVAAGILGGVAAGLLATFVGLNPIVGAIVGIGTALFLLSDTITLTEDGVVSLGDASRAVWSLYKTDVEVAINTTTIFAEKNLDLVAGLKSWSLQLRLIPALYKAIKESGKDLGKSFATAILNKLKKGIRLQIKLLEKVSNLAIGFANALLPAGLKAPPVDFSSMTESFKEEETRLNLARDKFKTIFLNELDGGDFFSNVSNSFGKQLKKVKEKARVFGENRAKEKEKRDKQRAAIKLRQAKLVESVEARKNRLATDKKQLDNAKKYTDELKKTLSVENEIKLLREIGEDTAAFFVEKANDILKTDNEIKATNEAINKLKSEGLTFIESQEEADKNLIKLEQKLLDLAKKKKLVAAREDPAVKKRSQGIKAAESFGTNLKIESLERSGSLEDKLKADILKEKAAFEIRKETLKAFDSDQIAALKGHFDTKEKLTADHKKRLDDINTKFDKKTAADENEVRIMKLRATAGLLGEMSELFAQFNKDGKKENKAAFIAQKAFAIASATISAAAGVLNALGQSTPSVYINYANAAAIAIAAGVQVGNIAAASFAQGGPIGGSGTGTSDSNLIWASNGEFMINSASTKANRALVEQINNSNGQTVNPNPVFVQQGSNQSQGSFTNSDSSSSSNVSVNIYNAPGTEATVQETETDEGRKIEVFIKRIDQALASNLNQGVGPLAATLDKRIKRKY